MTVFNRTVARAEELAGEFGASAAPLESAAEATADIWVNGTALGMHPDTGTTPLPERPQSWNPETVVFDTVYNPPTTRLLRDAKAPGCRTISGVEMFVLQAAAQFKAWTRQEAPLNTFRGVVESRLQPPA